MVASCGWLSSSIVVPDWIVEVGDKVVVRLRSHIRVAPMVRVVRGCFHSANILTLSVGVF